jgi:hypothetical protein
MVMDDFPVRGHWRATHARSSGIPYNAGHVRANLERMRKPVLQLPWWLEHRFLCTQLDIQIEWFLLGSHATPH